MTATDTCPSLEDLAAFLDGGLEGAERDRMVSHLNACPDCMDVYADVAQMARADEETGPMAPPTLPSPSPRARPEFRTPLPATPRRRNPWRSALSLAALLAAGVTGIWWLYSDIGRGADWSMRLATPAQAAPSMTVAVSKGLPKQRGHTTAIAGDPAWSSRQLAFQLGARSVDIDVAVATQSPELLKDLAPPLTHLLDEAGAASLLPTGLSYRFLEREKDGFRRLEKLRQELQVQMAKSPDFALGRFTEGARLAIAAGQTAWLEEAEVAAYPSWLLRQERWSRLRGWLGEPGIALNDEVRLALTRVEAILRGGVDPVEIPALRGSLYRLIGLYDPAARQTLALQEAPLGS